MVLTHEHHLLLYEQERQQVLQEIPVKHVRNPRHIRTYNDGGLIIQGANGFECFDLHLKSQGYIPGGDVFCELLQSTVSVGTVHLYASTLLQNRIAKYDITSKRLLSCLDSSVETVFDLLSLEEGSLVISYNPAGLSIFERGVVEKKLLTAPSHSFGYMHHLYGTWICVDDPAHSVVRLYDVEAPRSVGTWAYQGRIAGFVTDPLHPDRFRVRLFQQRSFRQTIYEIQ
jgi:hypothetical protein